jgi:hypothetical protein
MLYAMLDAQLSVVSQWKMHENIRAFGETEILFLNEYGVGVGTSWGRMGGGRQPVI